MSFDKKKSVRLAGVVLSGSLILSTSIPVAAQGPGTIPETAAHQTEEKTEKVVFLNTVPSADGEKQGPYDGQAVHSMEEVLTLFDGKEEEGPRKFELLKEETKILVLCGETLLSEEEMQAVNDLGILLMADTEYEALQKAKEESEKKAAEEKAKEEAEKKEADQKMESQEQISGMENQEPVIQTDPAGAEEPPAFLWEAPQVILSGSDKNSAETAEENEEEKELTSDETGVDAAGEEVKTPETSGILLPGFSVPSGQTEEKADEEEEAEADTKDNEEAVADKTSDSEDSSAAEEEETEEITEEEVVYTLFALFNEPEIVSEVADVEAMNALVADNEIESEEQQVEIPSVLALPGTDLVGGGTSGVGGGTKPSQSGSSSGSGSAGSSTGTSSSGNTSTGSASSGTASGNTSAAPSASSTPAVTPQTTVPSKNSVIQTGDSSNRALWGLTAGISGAMAAYFAVQWRKLKNALSK